MSKTKIIKKKSIWKKILEFISFSFLIALILSIILAIVLWVNYGDMIIEKHDSALQKVKEISASEFDGAQTSLIYDSSGNLLSKIKGDKETYYLRYADIPPTVRNAFIAIEDHRFLEHSGVDYIAIMRAALKIIESDGELVQGGSTITQQLARNVFLNYNKTIERKIEEIFIAFELEKQFPKEDILEFYINNINYGNNCYGIEAAARKYFGKSVKELSKSQMIYLCAIPQNPSGNDPLKYPNNTLRRRDNIIRAMVEYGYLEHSEATILMKEVVTPIKAESTTNNYLETYAKHAAIEVLMSEVLKFEFRYDLDDEERKQYDKKYEEYYKQAENLLKTNGYSIYTSLSLETQGIVQAKVDELLLDYTLLKSDGEYSLQAAITVIDNESGLVEAIVGGRTPINHIYTLNRAYQSYRQPGSTIKPLIAYTPYFSQIGNTPNKMVVDKVEQETENQKIPKGTGKRTSILNAIRWSYNGEPWNIVREMTPEQALSYLKLLNFHNIVDDDNGEAIALGGFTYGMNTLEMAGAYSTLARNGIFIAPTCITKIISSTGEEVYNHKNVETRKVYDERATILMTECLMDVVQNGTGKAANFSGVQIAGKTGTTNDEKDSWFAGYTPYKTAVIWAGHDTPKEDASVSQKNITASLFREIMAPIHKKYIDDADNIKTFNTKEELEQEKEEVLQTVEQEFISFVTPKISTLATKAIETEEDAKEFNNLYSEILQLMEEHRENISFEQYKSVYDQVEEIKREAWNDLTKYYVIPPTAPSLYENNNASNTNEITDNNSEQTIPSTQEDALYETNEEELSTVSTWE